MNFEDTFIGNPGTKKTYLCIFRKHILPYLPPEKAKVIKKNEIYGIYAKWEKLHPRSKQTCITVLQRYLHFHENFLNLKEFFLQNRAVIPSNKPKAMSKKSLHKILETAKKHNYEFYELLVFAAYTGARKEEILGLRYKDLDFENKKVYIYKTAKNNYTKNKKPRAIFFAPKMMEVIKKRNLLEVDGEMKVFNSRIDICKRLATVCKQANLPKISIHSFRHTYATLALNAKRPLKSVQAALGHKSLQTTIDTYWNTTEDVLDVDFI